MTSYLYSSGVRIFDSIIDNAFDSIEDFEKAQEICNYIDLKEILNQLDKLAKTYCPVHQYFIQVYH